MTYKDLIDLLVERQALIVHCSRPGKNGDDGPLFPDDMRKAIEILDAGATQLSCSVVWPEHQHSYGAVGIVLRPRSTASITSLKGHDAGASVDQATGQLVGGGVPFSSDAVFETFSSSTGYNEWTVGDADCLGIFVNLQEPLEVAAHVDMKDVDGFDSSMWDTSSVVGPVRITFHQIQREFPDAPIFALHDGKIHAYGAGPASPYSTAAVGGPHDGTEHP